MPIVAWLIEAAPSLAVAACFVAVYVVFLARVHSDARGRLGRHARRRRALDRVESWYPKERLLPLSLVAARSRLAAERRDLERAGILRPVPAPPRAS